jgi:pimeloyl-ACP methyl ester carboxylesterase
MGRLHTVVRDGIRMYDSVNSHNARRMVLLHGLGNSLAFWTAIAPQVATVRRVVALDMPGFGGSEPTSAVSSIEAFTGGIAQALVGSDVRDATVVGHSLGGIATLALAGDHASLVHRVVLIDACLVRASRFLQHPSFDIGRLSLATNLAAQFLGGALPRHLQWDDSRVPGHRLPCDRLLADASVGAR